MAAPFSTAPASKRRRTRSRYRFKYSKAMSELLMLLLANNGPKENSQLEGPQMPITPPTTKNSAVQAPVYPPHPPLHWLQPGLFQTAPTIVSFREPSGLRRIPGGLR